MIPTAPAILNAIHRRYRRAHSTEFLRRPTACARRCWPVLPPRPHWSGAWLTITPSGAMPARCSVTSSRDGRARATVTANHERQAGAARPACGARSRRVARRFGCPLPRSRSRLGWQRLSAGPETFVTAIGAGHDLSRLQTSSIHHFFGSSRRRHGHGGYRRHFQLLRRESEDRYRSPSRAGKQHRASAGRSPLATSPPANTALRCSRSAACATSPAAAARRAR